MSVTNQNLHANIPAEQNIIQIMQKGCDDTYVFCAPETVE